MTSDESLRKQLLTAAFKMPAVQTPVSRKSSITNAFVAVVIPVIVPTIEEIDAALKILEMQPDDVQCAYCGNKATEWDHLLPLVKNRRPTGYISEIANLVPACAKCNQSKGNTDWRAWMRNGKARHSPTGRGLSDVEARIARLEKYEQARTPTKIDFAEIIGTDEWESYWKLCEDIVAEMARCNEVAVSLRKRIGEALQKPA
jgi:hypothetical protein